MTPNGAYQTLEGTDMAGASKTSNKARTSTSRAGAAGANATFARFLMPTNFGQHAYVRSATTGLNPLLSTSSQAFIDSVKAITDAGYGDKVEAELVALAEKFPTHNWETTAARLREAGALPA